MKTSRFFPASLAAIVILCGEIPATFAAEVTLTVADDAIPLEKIADVLKQIKNDYDKQAAAFVAVVDAELAAKRIGENLAKLLSSLARNERYYHEVSMNIPKSNATLSAAIKELEAASRLSNLRRSSAMNGVVKHLRQQARDFMPGKPKPEEITSFIRAIQEFRELMPPNDGTFTQTQAVCENIIAIMGALKQVTDDGTPDPAISAAADALRGSTYRGDVFTQEETKEYLVRFFELMRKAVEGSANEIDALIEARKPVQEISAAVENYALAKRRLNQLTGDETALHGASDPAVFYRLFLGVLKSVEGGDFEEANRGLKNCADWNLQLDASRRADREQMINKLQKEITEKSAKLREQWMADISARMAAVKEPADISELMSGIEKWSRQMRAPDGRGGDAEEINQLMEPLRELQERWSNNSPVEIAQRVQRLSANRRQSPVAFQKEFAALRNRVTCIIYASKYKIPELTTAPYADKDPEAAIEALCDDFSKRGEWRRLLDILQTRALAAARGSVPKEDETITAIRSYLVGKNLELAEQWADAVQAYKSVLRSPVPRAPIQAAADSIKAIAKAHPDAVTGGSQ